MTITVTDTAQYVRNVTKRMPFHFGNVSVTESPHLFLRATAVVDGEEVTGVSMGSLGHTWYLKDPDLSMDEGIGSMVDVAEAAWTAAERTAPEPSVFDLYLDLYRRQREWAADTDYPPLMWNFGVSLVEQAVVDAFCRARDTTFGEAVRSNALGIDLGDVYDELAGYEPADLLPDRPRRSTAVRHTVGLTDPLTAADVDDGTRLDDGLPQTLAEYVDSDGVDHFKIKLSADRERDAERLKRIAAVVEESALDDFAFTIDANEQYASVRSFREQWESFESDPELARFIDHLLYVEQPLARDDAFTDETRRVFDDWQSGPPVIIDESDDRIDRLGTALDYGYAGTSHKNVKGVLKGVVNRCLVEHRRLENPDEEYVMSGEDMSNIGPVELLQDLAVVGTIGMDHVERNGHHYHAGLGMFPDDVQEAVLDAHDDLYRRHERGFATLDVSDGRIEFGSVLDAPFGYALDFDPSRFTPLDEWNVESIYE